MTNSTIQAVEPQAAILPPKPETDVLSFPFYNVTKEQDEIVKKATINLFFPNEESVELYDRIQSSSEDQLDFMSAYDVVDQHRFADHIDIARLLADERYRLLWIISDCIILSNQSK